MTVATIVVESLSCQRGGHTIVSNLSFEICAGQALILRGANGSGKTTLLRTIAGFLQPASGMVRVEAAESGTLPRHNTVLGKLDSRPGECGSDGHFHYIGHANGIKTRLTVIENVCFWQRYYAGGEDIGQAEAALDAFGLIGLADFRAAHLSQGQARRLGLARLLAARRSIWLLDEPSVSLDAASTKLLESAVASHLSLSGIAIISTHLDLALRGAQTLELGSTPALQ